jgi:hypothetical protein
MHVVLGDGEMTQKELTETLKDLWEQAGDESFWFVVQGKSEPTATDKNLIKFLHTNEIYYEVLTDDADAMADIYTQSQNTHVAKQLARKVVNLLNNSPEENEDADVLALYVSDDSEAEEDRWLNATVQAANDAGFKGFVLNDGMVEIELSGPGEPEPEPEEPPKPSKAPAKKVGAKKAAAAPVPESAEVPSREELEEMDLGELKEVAANLGITLPPRTRPKTYIDHILGETPAAPEAEVTPSTAVNTSGGTMDGGLSIGGVQISVEAVAAVAADMVMRRIVEALQSV